VAVSNFYGDTFVAYIDISGFKELMKQGKAITAMDKFYSHSYHAIANQTDANKLVEGIFVSDCGVLFVNSAERDLSDRLAAILQVIKQINKNMLNDDYMLTTSISYGDFKYQDKIEFEGIGKNAIYGGAYVKAFLDNENGSPKIQPGQCRIIKNEVVKKLLQNNREFNQNFDLISISNSRKHYYFYWNLESENQIQEFETLYQDAYNAKFTGMLKALKTFI